jgi:hypothetical protein
MRDEPARAQGKLFAWDLLLSEASLGACRCGELGESRY